MNKKDVILKNSGMGLVSQAIIILFTFLTRNLFIKYIGIELLGLNSTFSSVLNTLSLAELGFQSAIVFSLYKPLYEGAQDEINSRMNIFKWIYTYIGIFFVAASLVVTPLLKYIITGIQVTYKIYVYFIFQAFASTCTYFLAYKRALLYADQKDYISKSIDLFFNIIFSILQCVAIVVLRSYIIYLILKILQTYTANLVVHMYCTIHYPYLKKSKIDNQKLKDIWTNVKNIFAGRIASYIYTSTDNLVISAVISTISVGYFTNYTTITTSLKTLTNSILSPIVPIIGNYLVDESDQRKRENIFRLYTFARYLIALIIIVPTIILIDSFIAVWIGSEMILEKTIVFLLGFDFYIHIVHSATADFINGTGMFKEDKYVEIVGAITNISLSVVLVYSMGITGVLIGTVVSQMIFWFGRSAIVYFKCLKLSFDRYISYWLENVMYILLAIVLTCVLSVGYDSLQIKHKLIKFIAGGCICELIILIVVFCVFSRSKKMKWLINAFKLRCFKST